MSFEPINLSEEELDHIHQTISSMLSGVNIEQALVMMVGLMVDGACSCVATEDEAHKVIDSIAQNGHRHLHDVWAERKAEIEQMRAVMEGATKQ